MTKDLKTTPEKLKPFVFHGAELTQPSPKQAKGDCPFCGREGLFFVEVLTGKFQCKVCGDQGNIPVFLSLLHKYSIDNTSLEDYAPLVKDRGIPAEEMKAWGLAKSVVDGSWVLPSYNSQEKLANLLRLVHVYDAKRKKYSWKAYGTPGCKMHLFGNHFPTNKNPKKVWICEGPWDAMSARYNLGQVKSKTSSTDPATIAASLVRTTDKTHSLLNSIRVLAAPGCESFQTDWFDALEGSDLLLPFDNDHPRKRPNTDKLFRPGWEGTERIAKHANEYGKINSLSRIRWGEEGHDPNRPDGFDLRDLAKECGPVKFVQTVLTLSEEITLSSKEDTAEESASTVEPLARKSYPALCRDFSSSLHFTREMRDTLATMLAVAISTELKGDDQIWLRVIGPPGSGKTTLAECLSVAREYVFPKSMLTGFHSGLNHGTSKTGKKGRKDSSLIPLMMGKTAIIKDADTLISAPNRDAIMRELRDIYDGASRSHYRTGKISDYEDIRTTFILCGTDELRALNRTFLGERFLDCEILGDGPTDQYVDRAASKAYSQIIGSLKADTDEKPQKSDLLKRATYGYLKHLKESLSETRPPAFPVASEKIVKALGHLLSYMRARVRRDGKEDDLLYRPRAELATRLASQFVRLAVCLAIVLGREEIDNEVIRIVRKVMLDTAVGFQLEITQLLVKHPRGLSSKQLAHDLQLSENKIRRTLQDLQEFGIVSRSNRPNNSGIRGRDLHLWELSAKVKDLWSTAMGKG